MDIAIASLVDHPDLVETVARWCHQAFTPAMTLTQYTAALRAWLDDNDTLFIALDGPTAAGSAIRKCLMAGYHGRGLV